MQKKVAGSLRGLSNKKTIFPIIFAWIKLEELLEKEFCKSDIMINPGIKNTK